MTRKIKLILSYDGTGFCGWQIQNDQRSVQGELEKALAVLHKHPVKITGAGRTDSGVHAMGQTAHFETDCDSLPSGRFSLALNKVLPADIRVVGSEEVDADFHARFHARWRTYHYYILNRDVVPATYRNICYGIRNPLDLAELNRLAEPLLGVHDFTTFAAAGDVSKSKVREIAVARFLTEGPFYVFRITGNAFLWRMVRSVVGTLLEYHKDGKTPRQLKKALEARDRNQCGVTAPPYGLFLQRVIYEDTRNF